MNRCGPRFLGERALERVLFESVEISVGASKVHGAVEDQRRRGDGTESEHPFYAVRGLFIGAAKQHRAIQRFVGVQIEAVILARDFRLELPQLLAGLEVNGEEGTVHQSEVGDIAGHRWRREIISLYVKVESRFCGGRIDEMN